MKRKYKIISTLCLGVVALSALALEMPGKTATPTETIKSNLAASSTTGTVYVSPTGTSTGVGTKESPLNFETAIYRAEAGQNILLASGTYQFSNRINVLNSGEYNAYITVQPEEENGRVILDFSEQTFNSSNRGIQLTGDFWHFYNIEVTKAGDNGMYVAGNNNVIEQCQFYENSDTGLQIGRGYSSDTTIDSWPNNNLILNCTSFANYDAPTFGENADGFAAKLTVGYGNIFDGCIAYRNSDDGWDLYAKEDSGNIGTVSLYNCVAFENGFLPESHIGNDGAPTYNTVNGDGIGFKLGGSTMEGDVYVENCMAFNNKLHGFGDNSNPGVIQLKNCTAFNNCIGLNEDGSVSDVRGVLGSTNKSNNFDLARDKNSYNTYYGLVSYINNQVGFTNTGDNSYNSDAFRGTTAYSIFQTEYDTENLKEKYVTVTSYMDASSYSDDALAKPSTTFNTLKDDSFASLTCINAIDSKEYTLHTGLRNEDMSVNLGDLLKITDQVLLTYADGKAIGADLSKSSYEEYTHVEREDTTGFASLDQVKVQNAYESVEVLANVNAIYQSFELPVLVNECDIEWSSSNESILSISNSEKISISAAIFVQAQLVSPTVKTQVTLTAKISCGEATKEKTFNLTILPRDFSLGAIVSDSDSTFIVSRYQTFVKPNLVVTDASSINSEALDPSLYDCNVVYEYAENRNGSYTKVNDVYTSVPGVFKVTTTATSKIEKDAGKTVSYTYFVFISADECEIDFAGGLHTFSLNATGFNIKSTLSNTAGKIYAVVTPQNVNLFTYQEILAYEGVQVYNINSDKLNVDFEADNASPEGYKVYYVISDKVGRNFSNVYSKIIKSETITTCDEFYQLAQGLKSTNVNTIYNLTQDLDFNGYTWEDASSPQSFTATLNGNGYKISNITIQTDIQKQANIFYKLEGGTIMNVVFENISIINTNASGKLIGIIGAMNGGYVSNISMTNISAVGEGISSGSVGALIGQIIAGVNYIDHITLINDENQQISCGNKYAAGVVGNIQLDSGYSEAETYISYCNIQANIGDGNDSGGCTGGVVGRTKNDTNGYYLSINNCYYKGTITAKGNYNGGIVGDISSGSGGYTINKNFSDVVFIYSAEKLVLDAKLVDTEIEYQEYAHKNCNPIAGRANSITGLKSGEKNAGSWTEYYKNIISSVSIYFLYGPEAKPTASLLSTFCDWDMENDWTITDEGVISLR